MKRTASPVTAKYLQNAAVFYLERYASSAEGLRRVLRRRVSKARLLEALGDIAHIALHVRQRRLPLARERSPCVSGRV